MLETTLYYVIIIKINEYLSKQYPKSMDGWTNEWISFPPFFLRETPGSQLPSNWKVYIGLVSQLQLPSPYFVKQIILHENYDPATKNNDIALLKLNNPASEFIHTQKHTQS